ncbi:hypothetical protein C4A67_01211 [Escherichia coli]|nr:hypothetical protein C4A67_01211 [Escherichia coli]RDQ09864.1 hypothetical protein C4A37_00871 [Escherichia coli]
MPLFVLQSYILLERITPVHQNHTLDKSKTLIHSALPDASLFRI